MFKLMAKKIIAILRKLFLLHWPYVICTTLLPNFIQLRSLQWYCCKHLFPIRMENTVDLDQMQSTVFELLSPHHNLANKNMCASGYMKF